MKRIIILLTLAALLAALGGCARRETLDKSSASYRRMKDTLDAIVNERLGVEPEEAANP